MKRQLKTVFGGYSKLPTAVLKVTAVQFLIELVNAAFTLILNIYLRKTGLTDGEIAALVAWRYLGILLFAFPLGLYIRTHRIKPFFYAAALAIPVMSWALLLSASHGYLGIASAAYFIWGSGFMMIQVCVIPFILRNSERDTDTEALSLGYSTFSIGLILSSLLISLFTFIGSTTLAGYTIRWNELSILLVLSSCCLLAIPILYGLRESKPEAKAHEKSLRTLVKSYDWKLIGRALLPTTFIAIGAGFTFPFMNLFFNSVFGMEYWEFSEMGLFTAALVVLAALLVPYLRRKFGYGVAITLSQSLAVALLIGLLLTEPFRHVPGMYWVAIGCYMLRSPLMNMTAPITNDLIMRYVGPGNREMVSALFSSIWSGSAFFSSKMFQSLRELHLDYWKIFAITAGLYVVGVVAYVFLIRDYHRRLKATENS